MRIVTLLFIALAILYYQSAPRWLADFRYMTLVARGIWQDGDITLDDWAPAPHGSADAVPVSDVLPYQFAVHGGHVYHYFPIGTAALIAPFVGIAESLGYSTLDESGAYDPKNEARIQHYFASICTALLVAIFFLQTRLYLSWRPALFIALAAGLGTPLWSTGGGTLWSHTLSTLGLGTVLALLMRAEQRNEPPNGIALGCLLAWMFFVRPTTALSIGVLLPYVIWRWRRAALPAALTAAGWLVLFSAHSQSVWGQWLPPYFQTSRVGGGPTFEALAGNLISPARGLLIYVPALVPLAALLIFRWRRLAMRPLVALGAFVCVLHWLVVSSYPHWWGGHSWGPRLMLDLTPWWVFFAIVVVAEMSERAESSPLPLLIRPQIATFLVGVGVLMHGIGALSSESGRWNADVEIDAHPERLWDWQNPPFLHWRQASRE